MCPIPEIPNYSNQCAVDQSGSSSACSSTQTRYRNLFVQSIANLPSDASDSQVDSLFHCPITGDFIVNPVISPDGITYERNAILAWLRTNPRDPMTRSPLSSNQLRPNNLARTLTTTYTGVDPATLAEPFNDQLVGHSRRDLRDVMNTFTNNIGRIVAVSHVVDRVPGQLGAEASNECNDGNPIGSSALSIGSTVAAALQPFVEATLGASVYGASTVSSADASTVGFSNSTVSSVDSSSNNQSSEQQTTPSSRQQAPGSEESTNHARRPGGKG